MTVTLAELKQQARERADMVNSNFVSDSELTSYINASIAELHDILVQSYNMDYFLEEHSFSTVANQADYSLPADFYKLRGCDARINNDNYSSIRQFNFNERNRFEGFGVWSLSGISNIRYRLVGNSIRFTPIPDSSSVQIRLWYTPVATKLVSDSDTMDNYNGYEEYVIVDSAIRMLQKEESDVSVLVLQKQELKKRLEEASQNRDTGDSESVTDIYAENNEYWYWTSRGDS